MPAKTLWFACAVWGALASCEDPRERPGGDGVHPDGWAIESEENFHGTVLREDGYPLDECRDCHGADLDGGDVGRSCTDGSCHTGGVADCAGTCHGDDEGPRPSGAFHAAHGDECSGCHPVPGGLEDATHLSGSVDVAFAGLARAGGAEPIWNASERSCSGTYCHGDSSPTADQSGPLACNTCHEHRPGHQRFAAAFAEGACAQCHDGSPGAGHVDGELDLADLACNACHGASPTTGGVPPGLAGTSDASDPGVGAHRRHTDSLLVGRIGRVVPCSRCHPVPSSLLAPGHLDRTAPADVELTLGSYDADTGRCVDACHWDRQPGPMWNDDSGDARQCDSCHLFPPTVTRKGTPHPAAEPSLSVCTGCHPFSAPTHVDGEVNL